MKTILPNFNRYGFTLVELLVVISIIAILSVIGMATYSGVQKGARDAKRKEDVQAIQKVLEAHYNDTTCGAATGTPYCFITTTNASTLFANGSIPFYPPHSDGTTTSYNYPGTAASATYIVCAKLDNSTGNYNCNSGCTTQSADLSPVSGNTGGYYCLKNQQ